MKSLNHVRLFVTPRTVAYQVLPSMGFSRQEYWRGLPFPSPEDLPDPGIEPGSPALKANALLSDPMDYTVHGILQARILEWVAFPFSRSSQPRNLIQVSCIADGFFTS